MNFVRAGGQFARDHRDISTGSPMPRVPGTGFERIGGQLASESDNLFASPRQPATQNSHRRRNMGKNSRTDFQAEKFSVAYYCTRLDREQDFLGYTRK